MRSVPLALLRCSFFSSSDLPGSFQSALQGALTAKDYMLGIRTTIKVGGCNASRSGFIGACLAAQVSTPCLAAFHGLHLILLMAWQENQSLEPFLHVQKFGAECRIVGLHLAVPGRKRATLGSAQESGWTRLSIICFICTSSSFWNTELLVWKYSRYMTHL